MLSTSWRPRILNWKAADIDYLDSIIKESTICRTYSTPSPCIFVVHRFRKEIILTSLKKRSLKMCTGSGSDTCCCCISLRTGVRLICMILIALQLGLFLHNAILVDSNNGHFLALTGKLVWQLFVTIMTWVWVWLDCLQIDSDGFILFAEINQILHKISLIPIFIFLTFMYLVELYQKTEF